jgi:hypothetical protein
LTAIAKCQMNLLYDSPMKWPTKFCCDSCQHLCWHCDAPFTLISFQHSLIYNVNHQRRQNSAKGSAINFENFSLKNCHYEKVSIGLNSAQFSLWNFEILQLEMHSCFCISILVIQFTSIINSHCDVPMHFAILTSMLFLPNKHIREDKIASYTIECKIFNYYCQFSNN